MRTLGIDLGTARIGVALSDPDGIFASPLLVLKNSSLKENVKNIINLAKKHNCTVIVVGMPFETDGSVGVSARRSEKLVKELEKSFDGVTDTVDERFTTVSAERSLLEADVKRSKRKTHIDKVAAAIILQSYLDSQGDRI